ncbi:hypothetical protein BH09ACT8_BH09ACT8_56800 [soil metagenome]
MPVEETDWDVRVSREVERRHGDCLRATFEEILAKKLPADKRLRRVVGWSANGGCLYRPRRGDRQFAVSYEVELAV